jgi:hypothetical protein
VEAVKNALAVLVAIIGALTALLTLYAKYLDVKKSAARESDAAMAAATRPEPTASFAPADEPVDPIAWHAPPFARYVPPSPDFATIERARLAVKAPATTLIVAGLVSLFFNLFIAGFGYVDRFVTPLTTESKNQRAFIGTMRPDPTVMPGMVGTVDKGSDEANVVLTIVALMSFSLASGVAIWAGIGMLRLRSYWLSVAGSFAIMGGASFCCMGGIPIGVWSLMVLFKPEVSSSFR